jgi:hypothetical protein
MNPHKLFRYGLIAAFAVMGLILCVAVPVAAHGGEHACDNSHPDGICLDGLVCGVTIPGHTAIGECKTCDIDWKLWKDGTCAGSTSDVCQERQGHHPEHRHGDYDCHNDHGYQSCGVNMEQTVTVIPDHYGCAACPEGQHKDGDNLCVPGVCGVNFFCTDNQACSENTCQVCPAETAPNEAHTICVANPVVQSSAPPMQFKDDYWKWTLEPCAGLGSDTAISLVSYDNERLYVTLTHNGFFDAQIITHDPESDDMFLQGCQGRDYYRSTCSIERLSGVGVLSFTITGTRDFRVIAVPELQTDDQSTSIQIINHAVDYSGISDGRILDQNFMRTEGMFGCPQDWLTGIQFYGPL